MANVDAPNGLRPVGTNGQACYIGKVERMFVPATDATAIYVGDLVKQADTGSDATGKFMAVTQGTAAAAAVGVVVGIEPLPFTDATSDELRNVYRAASTARYLLVDTDPNTIFVIQEVSGGTALTATMVGLNASVVVGSGNTTTGASGMELDNSTEGTGATLELKVLGVYNIPDNALGEHCKWLVKINNHQRAASTGTAGV